MQIEYLWKLLGECIQLGLRDPDIFEVILNPDLSIWFLSKTRGSVLAGYMDVHDAERFVHAVAHLTQQYLTPERPYLDATLPFNGERICITVPPASLQVSFNIRKKETCSITLTDYVNEKVMTEAQASSLKRALLGRKKILVSGGPASGKTTLLNALLDIITSEVKGDPRIVILEQTPELTCRSRQVKNMMESEHVDLNRLLWLSLRNSPEWLVIGEVRDGAALDMLKAFNTGCQGALATLHANSAEGTLQRVLDLAAEAVSEPPINLVLHSIDVIAHLESLPHSPGKRCLTGLMSVKGYNRETQHFELVPLIGEGR